MRFEAVADPGIVTARGVPAVLVLTGEDYEGEARIWAKRAAQHDWPLFTVLSGPEGAERGRALGAHRAFHASADPVHVARAAVRTLEGLRIQRKMGIVGRSRVLRLVLDEAVSTGHRDRIPVLITGESGTGKELLASAVHEASPRRAQPLVAVNVAALSESLLETELFGHEEGAFTGATRTRKGCFEQADGGTLFLDEVGELPHPTQVKLLRALETGTIRRVGAERSRPMDVRVLTATHQDLPNLVQEGRFREDLYYRLDVLRIHVPPLRRRKEDIALLAHRFAQDISRRTGQRFPGISESALRALSGHHWGGNVREFRNVMERLSVAVDDGADISATDVRSALRTLQKASALGGTTEPIVPESVSQTAEYVDFLYHIEILQEEGGNRTRTAERLGIHRSTLIRRLARWEGKAWWDGGDPSALRGGNG